MNGNVLFPAALSPCSFSLSHRVCIYHGFLLSRDAHSCFPSSLLSSLGQLSFFYLSTPGATWKLPHGMIASTLF